MLLAIVDGQRRKASPGLAGSCPGCGGLMRAKCGEVLTWHWAHLSAECDPWSEPESQWHLDWKSRFPEQCQEVVIGPHRADVKGATAVLEIQKSGISPAMIREREEFYGQMLWMLCGRDFAENFKAKHVGKGVYRFQWKNPRKSWGTSEKRLLIDFGEIFEITEIDKSQTPWIGLGRFVSAIELYESICGVGTELVSHEWYLKNAVDHASRKEIEEDFDKEQERRRLEEERRIEEIQRQRDLEEWLYEQRIAAKIAADLELQKQRDAAQRKSNEEFELYLENRRKAEARQKALEQATKRAEKMLFDAQEFALEQTRGDIYEQILSRRPSKIKDIGHWSTSDLLDLLFSLRRSNITAAFCEQVRQQQTVRL